MSSVVVGRRSRHPGWGASLRESLVWTAGVVGGVAGALAALRALVAFQLGGAFWSPDFGTLLAWSAASAALVWPLAAILFRQREAAQGLRAALQWSLLATLASVVFGSALGAWDGRFLRAVGALIAPDILS